MTADVERAALLPRLELLVEDHFDLLGEPLVLPAEPLGDHLRVAERLPHRLERRRHRDLDSHGVLVGHYRCLPRGLVPDVVSCVYLREARFR